MPLAGHRAEYRVQARCRCRGSRAPVCCSCRAAALDALGEVHELVDLASFFELAGHRRGARACSTRHASRKSYTALVRRVLPQGFVAVVTARPLPSSNIDVGGPFQRSAAPSPLAVAALTEVSRASLADPAAFIRSPTPLPPLAPQPVAAAEPPAVALAARSCFCRAHVRAQFHVRVRRDAARVRLAASSHPPAASSLWLNAAGSRRAPCRALPSRARAEPFVTSTSLP